MQLRKADPLLSILGLRMAGDLGPLTLWTSRFRAVLAYPRTKPRKPPTHWQQAQRIAFSAAAAAWRYADPATKARLRRFCQKTRPPYTAYNLWLSICLKPDPHIEARIARIAGNA